MNERVSFLREEGIRFRDAVRRDFSNNLYDSVPRDGAAKRLGTTALDESNG